MKKHVWRIVFCLVTVLLFLNSAYAHDLGVVRMELIEKDSFHYTLLVKLPIETEIETPPIILPQGFFFTEKEFTTDRKVHTVTHYNFRGDRNLSTSDTLTLPWILDGAFIEANWLDGSVRTILIKEGGVGITIFIGDLKSQNQSTISQVKNYLLLGVEHILFGWDHLAFVLALCLISSRTVHLIKLITAFTIGHSITLAMASLGVLTIPILPVEACIAVSIALIAKESFKEGHKVSNSMWVVIAFGLLHGLGFASVLGDIGIEKSELLTGLISFNVGVELGQILFVVVVMSLFYLLSKQLPKHLVKTKRTIAFSLGVLAFFWFFQRVESFYY